MTTLAARPRWLPIGVVILLVRQVANVIEGMNQAAAGLSSKPPWVVAVNGGSMVSLIAAILVGPKYPRAQWALVGLSLTCLVASVVAVRQLRG
jgi:hypothetical protein